LQGFRRVFAHSAPIFFERGIANPETKVWFELGVFGNWLWNFCEWIMSKA
jgi:hypothetical protein